MSEPTRYEAVVRTEGVNAHDCRTAAQAQLRALGPPYGDGHWDLVGLEFAPFLRAGQEILRFEATGRAEWIPET